METNDGGPAGSEFTEGLGGERAAFEAWWAREGQFVRSGGGDYEMCFSFAAWQARAAPQPAERVPRWLSDAEIERLAAVDFPSKQWPACVRLLRAAGCVEPPNAKLTGEAGGDL